MASNRLGPYQIEALLGAGGMGQVYRARDPRLGRAVAIKVLADHIAADSDSQRRFTAEARAAASLNHPNICAVYEVGHDSGVDYLVMELVDGQPLSDQIPADGLPVSTAMRYGRQISDALAHAHERGVVHGDLKSRNVMITAGGAAKVVDFGLARRIRAAESMTLTETSVSSQVAGTPACMAPEVLRGEKPDKRSDLWALGVLLHETLSGALPFPGKTVPEISSAILHDAPRALPSHVPLPLAAVVRRLLAKESADRYQSAVEVRTALETLASGTEDARTAPPIRRRHVWLLPTAVGLAVLGSLSAYWFLAHRKENRAGPTSLAVLPCRALAERDRLASLEVGIADSVITALSNAGQLRVRSTAAILRYQGQEIDPQAVGKTLVADYLLTCTLQPTSDRFSASIQLVRTADGTSVWGGQYTVQRGDLLGLRDQIASRVATGLRIRLTEAERERFYRRYTNNAAAYERYVEGHAALARFTHESTLLAMDKFQSALELDPSYALAHAGLASAAALMRIRFAPENDVQQWFDLAHREADEALRLDPELAEAHEARAAVARNAEFDWDRTMQESDRALALNPSLAQPHLYRAAALYHYGLFPDAEREVRLGMSNDPVNRAEPLRLLGNIALFEGRFADAAPTLEQAQRLSESAVTGSYLAQALYYSGRKAEAEALLARVHEGAQAERRAQAALASVLAARGERDRAKILVETVQSGTYMDHHVAYSLGATYAQLGLRDDALAWLGRAASEGFPCATWFRRDPLLSPLRDDPRFATLIADIQRRIEQFRAKYEI